MKTKLETNVEKANVDKTKDHPDRLDWWPDASKSQKKPRERMMEHELIRKFKQASPRGQGLWGMTSLVQYICHHYDREVLEEALMSLQGFPDVNYPVRFFCRELEKLTGAVEAKPSSSGMLGSTAPAKDGDLSPPGTSMSWGERMRAWHLAIDDVRVACRIAGDSFVRRMEWLEKRDKVDGEHVYNIAELYALRDEAVEATDG